MATNSGRRTAAGVTKNELRRLWFSREEEWTRRFADGTSTFVENLLPEDAVAMPVARVLEIYRARFGSDLDRALGEDATATHAPPSPWRGCENGSWLRRANVVGINLRTVGGFAGALAYLLTIPQHQNAVHVLPFWEPGVVGSLYGMASFRITGEFFSQQLAEQLPHLHTPDRQLAAVVNLIHLTGRAAGMEVIPHTDRFSEMVLAYPQHFEWLRREGARIVDHSADLHEEVRGIVAAETGMDAEQPHYGAPDEEALLERLFGPPRDVDRRNRQRGDLAKAVYTRGYEPVPATMAPPYRGIEVVPESFNPNEDGFQWVDYRIQEPESMSRVFGPLTRYKLYERRENNRHWKIDFGTPREETWQYVLSHYADVQSRFGFDFMRGDMSHVQMRPEGPPCHPGPRYDLLAAVRDHIRDRNGVRSFSYFAETFMAAPGVMAYGNELDHLDACDTDVTLGDLQSIPVDDPGFLQRVRWYRDVHEHYLITPCLTMMTGDKDDPRFDRFYLHANVLRMFLGVFITDMPSYMGLGFSCRDIHHAPAPNEHYTKLFVFQESSGPKATHGPYVFGSNAALFERLTDLRSTADRLLPELPEQPFRWLMPPAATADQWHMAWGYGDRPALVFVAHAGAAGSAAVRIPLPAPVRNAVATVELEYRSEPGGAAATRCDTGIRAPGFAPAECRIYRVVYT